MPDQVPKAVVQERFDRLAALQDRISLEENQKQVGREVHVLVSTGEGKKDSATHRLTGRAEDNRLVHFELPADDVERAQTFYREAFGWQVNSMPGMGYALLTTTPTDEQGRPAAPGGINTVPFVA